MERLPKPAPSRVLSAHNENWRRGVGAWRLLLQIVACLTVLIRLSQEMQDVGMLLQPNKMLIDSNVLSTSCRSMQGPADHPSSGVDSGNLN